MAELPNYPFVNQLNSPTLDGKPDENKWFNCVVCSILSAILYFRPDLRGKIEPDSMKGAVYGEGYANKGTDAAMFVNYVAQFGLKLYSINEIPGKLIDEAHKLIQSGKPAIFTEIDPYCTEYQRTTLGWTHVCSFYKELNGGLDAMDPFGGIMISNSDAIWAEKVVGNQVWTVEPVAKEEELIIDIVHPEVAKEFELANTAGNAWRCRSNGKIIQGAMLEDYRTNGVPLCGLSRKRLPVSNEIPIEKLPVVGVHYEHLAGKGIVVQYYETGPWVYDPDHLVDNPPGATSVYPLKVYDPTNPAGQGPIVTELQAELATSGNVSLIQSELDKANAKIKAAEAALA